ncbi:MAG: class I SAM-dependent methyltransferase [Gammaproteobacteria bacterium]|nr:class I SAM-dependent methyltransferase [Gammaproteobacteria bacterium]
MKRIKYKFTRMEKIGMKISKHLIDPVDELYYRKFYRFPFGTEPPAQENEYIARWERIKRRQFPVVDAFEKEAGFAIDAERLHAMALATAVVTGTQSPEPYQHGRLLYATLARFLSRHPGRNVNILETGTARGFSALCMAECMKDNGGVGRIITLDVLPHNVKMFWDCIRDKDGMHTRSELLADYQDLVDEYMIFCQGETTKALRKIDIPRIHFAFLDARHHYDSVMAEFDYVKTRQREGDVVFFDDYAPKMFPGVVRAIDEVCETCNYSKRVISIDESRGYAIGQKR